MKTAISVPDAEFERYEQVARKHGMNRSEFYRRAAQHFADSLEGSSDLTRVANDVLAQATASNSQVIDDDPFLRESERLMLEKTEW